MRAVQIQTYGDLEVLQVREVPQPMVGSGEVLIRVHGAGVNPVDWKTRQGRGAAKSGGEPPLILGWDVAGVIETVSSEVTQFQVGDRVFGLVRFPQAGSTYAEYVAAPAQQLALVPQRLTLIEAAGVPLASLTAWQGLFDTGQLAAGQTVLIQAAAGGVGHFAVQLAKARGARVIGTASTANVSFLQSLGIDQVIDYKITPFETLGSVADVVLDTLGGEIQVRSCKVLKPGGILVLLTGSVQGEVMARHGVRGERILVHPDGEQLQQIAQLIEGGQVRPQIEAVFPLTEVRAAHQLSQTGHGRGKIVLQVKP